LIKKLLLIGAILAIGILAYQQFGSTINEYVPISAVAQDIGELKDTAVNRVGYELNNTATTVGNKIDQIKPTAESNPIKKIEQVIAPPKTSDK
jgi:cell fate (sporulation/competence/biofilm development) regulator YmcA (YheA/YmcA/DUF963 family)